VASSDVPLSEASAAGGVVAGRKLRSQVASVVGTEEDIDRGRLFMAEDIKRPMYDLLHEFADESTFCVTAALASMLLNKKILLSLAGSPDKVERDLVSVWAALFACESACTKIHRQTCP